MVLFACLFALGAKPELRAPAADVVNQWDFAPVYALERNARNVPGVKESALPGPAAVAWPEKPGPVFFGNAPTESKYDLLGSNLPVKEMSVELWVLYHVNTRVGALAGTIQRESASGWYVAVYENKIYFGLKSSGANPSKGPTLISEFKPRPWKKWFYHVVAAYDGEEMKLYVNGELAGSSRQESGEIAYAPGSRLNVFGYFAEEPHMQLGNLVREFRVYNRAMNESEVKSRLEYFQRKAEEGVMLTDALHFAMGPILQNVSRDSVTIVWETDRATTGVVKFGAKLPLKDQAPAREPGRIHKVTLTGLEPGSPYFYSVTAAADEHESVESGTLTFQTAPAQEGPISFAVIGDTETRPFINDRLAKLVWGERPNFGVIVGDLTDEGYQDNKWQYNYEFFAGMGQVLSRVNFFMTPGNSEKDGYWFSRYFDYPGGRDYYKFSYGNADFFVLNSNLPNIPILPGTAMYDWLEKELAASQAQWKFVTLHYAPFSSDENDYGDTWRTKSKSGDAFVRGAVPLFEKYGVDIVFYGHLHCYERSWPVRENKVVEQSGVIYVMSGGGGGNLEDFAPTRTWFANTLFRGHHYCLVNINAGKLQFKAMDLEGRIRDAFVLEK